MKQQTNVNNEHGAITISIAIQNYPFNHVIIRAQHKKKNKIKTKQKNLQQFKQYAIFQFHFSIEKHIRLQQEQSRNWFEVDSQRFLHLST